VRVRVEITSCNISTQVHIACIVALHESVTTKLDMKREIARGLNKDLCKTHETIICGHVIQDENVDSLV